MRKLISATMAAAVTVSALAAPVAEARHNRWGHRDRIDVDATDVIAGVLILGTIASIANSGKKRDRDRRAERYEPPYRPDYQRDDDRRYDRRDDRYDDRDYRGASSSDAPAWNSDGAARTEAGRAADACAWAAEGQLGNNARTTAIDRVTAEGDGWSVAGRVESSAAGQRGFQCTYRAGRVSAVSVEA